MHKCKLGLLLGTTLTLVAGAISFSPFTKEEIAQPGVAMSEGNGLAEKGNPSYTPIDSEFNSYKSENSNKTYHDYVGNIYNVWDKYQGEGVRIAYIDSGIDIDHPDFFDEYGQSIIDFNTAAYFTHISNPSDSDNHFIESGNSSGKIMRFSTSVNGNFHLNGEYIPSHQIIEHRGATTHGTNVAGTLAAHGHVKSGTGTIGIAPRATLIPFKCDFYTDTIGEILNYIHTDLNTNPATKVDVINISIEATSTWSTIAQYARACTEDGTIIFASAGNHTTSNKYYPASDPYIIGVGALSKFSTTEIATYSNFNSSFNTNFTNNTDITVVGNVYVPDDGGTYKETQGTSFSSPIAAAAAALWKEKYPNKTYSQFLSELVGSCVDLGNSSNFGYGRLDISALLGGTSDIVPVTGISMESGKGIKIEETTALNVVKNPSTASKGDVIWYTDDGNIANVNATGTITGCSQGVTQIHAISAYNPQAKADCSIIVESTSTSSYYQPIYDSTSGDMSGDLHTLMFNTHSTYTNYDACKNPTYYYGMEPGSSSNYIIDFYTQRDIAKTWGEGAVGTWNREHVWCQSLSKDPQGNQLYGTSQAGSDLHHLRPVESTLNSTRNDSQYGIVSQHTSSTEAYSKDKNKNKLYLGGWTSGDVFEPLDSVKGNVARIIMYLYTHYATGAGGSTPSGKSSYCANLQLHYIMNANSEALAKELLLEWHHADPVDSAEMVRNNYAASIQGNRNPYIDHPEWADLAFSDSITRVTGVSLNKNSTTLLPGGTDTLTATVSPSNADNKAVTWSTSNSNVATVSNGTITAVAPGSATITVTTVDGSKTDTCVVTVNKIRVESISIKSETSIVCGKNETLSVSVLPTNASEKGVIWSTADSSIATVDSSGKVTGVSVGTTTITATSKDNSNITSSCTVHINPILVTGISINQTSKTLDIGGTTTYTVTVTPSNASNKTVQWNSSNPSVATVDQNGKVTAIAAGTTNITASATDGSGVVSEARVITVAAKFVSISFVDLPSELDFGSHGGLYRVQVQKDFSDGTHTLIEEGLGATSILTVDTTTLGSKTVKAVFTGATTITATVKVTNHNSSQEPHVVEGTTTTTTITHKTFSGNGNQLIDGETFTMQADTTYFDYDGTKGQQIGKATEPITKASVIKRSQMRATRVVVNSSGASDVVATMKVKVGSTYFAYKGVASPAQASTADAEIVDSVALTATATDYVFEGDATGDIAIEWEQTSKKAIYLKSIEVTTETTVVESFTGREQAEAWANYFIEKTRGTNGPCLLSNETSKVSGLKDLWNDVKYEYENMTDDGKDAFCDPATSTLIHDCLVHYQFIVSSYGSKGPLTDFVKDSNNDAPQVVSNAHRIINEVFNDSSIMIALISVVGIAAIGVFVICKKRKEN